jgi:hypothetical protein
VSRASRASRAFGNVRSEGGLLPQDLLARIHGLDKNLSGLAPASYHLDPHERIGEAVNRAWSRLTSLWRSFREAVDKESEGALIGFTRDRWLWPLFQELGYGRLPKGSAIEVEGKSYAVSHTWHRSPIHLLGWNVDLDTRQPGVAGAARTSPHGLVQEFLNRSEQHLWGFLSNGKQLRILRDHHSLTRQAYVEFDLQSIMDGEQYSEFLLLWLLCHQSRVEAENPAECWLETWFAAGRDQGVRALDKLRDGVRKAIESLGSGFIHPDNTALRDALQSGALDKQEYYRQVLRLVYRIIFLFVAEERDALLELADPDRPDDPRHTARKRYERFYAARKLRELAGKRRGGPHGDLWHHLRMVMDWLDEGRPELALPALGSALWSRNRDTARPDIGCPWIMDAACANEHLLDALRHLSQVEDGRTVYAVSWRNVGAEELGSIYESLLELHPEMHIEAGFFELKTAAGHERKTTGSYYTPTSLVESLLDTALDPVLDQAARQPDPERAILDLKVCDPACGSGHFLLAAARRMARRLARVRAGGEEPSPREVQEALRDVVGRCIHGVDLNPMAVELCKVSLWMEAMVPGRPLSFLDGHIQHGNSLLGATPALMARGIPDDAWSPIEGDDKTVATRLKKRNKKERTGQEPLFAYRTAGTGDDQQAVVKEAAVVEATPDAVIADVRKKASEWQRLQQSPAFRDAWFRADAWCSAFVWPKPKEQGEFEDAAVTEGLWQRIARDTSSAPQLTRKTVRDLARQYRFFHWHLAFPHVFRGVKEKLDAADVTGWQGGFDVVLGNPPWERLKLQEKEWFATRAPDVANAKNAAERKKAIAKLQAREEDAALWAAWQDALRAADGESYWVRASGRYPLCGRGDINTYAIFAENNRSLLSPRARAGFITPTGIATDATTSPLMRHLVEHGGLASLESFENFGTTFGAVNNRQSFCLITLSAAPVGAMRFEFHVNQPLPDNAGPTDFTLTPAEFALLNPNTGTCPTFRARRDAEIVKAIYRRVPVLWKDGDPSGDPWGMSFKRMLDMANDSGLFHTHEQLQSEGWRLEGNVFVREGHRMLPLYEAKMVQHFDHRFATVVFGDPGNRPSRKFEGWYGVRTDDPDELVMPRYWVDEAEVRGRLEGRWSRGWLFGWRDICRSTDQRTVIAGVIPRTAVGHTTPLVIFPEAWQSLAGQFAANFASFIFDYVGRQKIGGTHLTYGILEQLPVLAPGAYTRRAPWETATDLGRWLCPRVLELTYTAWDLEAFGRDLGHEGPPFRWDTERRFWLRAELDAAFFHLYGITRDDVDYIMETFPIVKRKDEEAHGTYRTKEAILAIYDRMQRAIDSGEPYQTMLDPPPADPRVAHPPRTQGDAPPAVLRLRDIADKPAPAPPFVLELAEDETVPGGPRRFRCQPLREPTPGPDDLVLVKHPKLKRGKKKIGAAVGRWRLDMLQDAATEVIVFKLTLLGVSPPAELRLGQAEWDQFRPVGILEPLDE